MPDMILSLHNLHELDNGKAVTAMNHALRQIALDIQDRPGDKTIRSVEMLVRLKPRLDADSNALDCVVAEIIIKTKIPARRTPEYALLLDREAALHFNTHSPFDPRQSDLPFPEVPEAGSSEAE